MTLQRKVLLGYGTALMLVGSVLVWAIVNLVHLGRASDAILRENYRSILAADNMIASLERQDSAALLALLGYPEQGLTQRRQYESEFLQWLGRAKDNVTIPGEAEIVAAIEAEYAQYRADLAGLERVQRGEPQQAASFYHQAAFPAFQRVRDSCAALKTLNQNTMQLAGRRAERVASKAIWSTTGIGLLAIGAGLVFSILLSQHLVRPVQQLIATAQRISEGKYDVRVPARATDELGQLAREFNAMAQKLQAYHNLNVDETVAEKRKSQAILRSIEDGVVVVDSELRVTNINPTAMHLLELAPGEAEGESLSQIIADQRVVDYVRETATTGRPPEIGEDNILTMSRQDDLVHLMFSVTPVQARSEGMLGVVVLLRDVTRLKEVDRLKSQFIMTASHELRTPLTSIAMSVDLLRERVLAKLDEKETQLLGAAHDELRRLQALVDDLLNLSRIEAGRIELEFASVPLSLLFEQVTSIFAAQAETQQVSLVAVAPPDLPSAHADPNKITWVLTNLVSNALRYVSGGGRIALSARCAGSQLFVSVDDDGVGIEPAFQDKVFEKFVQIRDAGEARGSGLGLAICREIVRAHGGTIWVESAAGEGSVFTFTLSVGQ